MERRADKVELVVFSDDWGRHPSSCQHLVGQLLPRYPVCWVNTIGTRRPGLDAYSLRRAGEKLAGWLRGSARASSESNPRVVAPLMWPSFGSRLSRRLNHYLLKRAVEESVAPKSRRIGITTLPIAADLVGSLPATRWIYYCVDDLSEWPGLDGRSLRVLERDLVRRVDAVVAVSDKLVARMAGLKRNALLLTHGVDLEHWRASVSDLPGEIERLARPLVVFWGVVDPRLDVDWLRSLDRQPDVGTIVLVGPANNPAPELLRLSKVVHVGPLPYESLPAVAEAAAVLVMPYRDSDVTRAMQPLKLKEYLATGRPVVARDLPAVEDWQAACDVASTADEFCGAVLKRLRSGIPQSQVRERERLVDECWSSKAALFERVLRGEEVDESALAAEG